MKSITSIDTRFNNIHGFKDFDNPKNNVAGMNTTLAKKLSSGLSIIRTTTKLGSTDKTFIETNKPQLKGKVLLFGKRKVTILKAAEGKDHKRRARNKAFKYEVSVI